MAPSPLRVALVGLGEAGATIHLPAFARVSSASVVGACDLKAARRDAATRKWGVPTFDRVDAMLETLRPDVVSIATPPDQHAALCLQAIHFGAHVFCEKPFVPSAAEADEVVAAAEVAGRIVVVNHEFREMPIFRALIDAVRSGRDGELLFAQAWQQIDLLPWRESGWRGDLARRVLFEAGVHQLDLLLELFGEPPEAVRACTSSAGLDAMNRDALVVAILEFPRGRLATLTLNRLTKGEPQYSETRVDLARAAYRASFGGRARLSAGFVHSSRPHLRLEFGRSGVAWREQGASRRLLARNPSDPNVVATARVIAQAVDAWRSGTPAPTSAASARTLMEVVDACYRAAETGQRIRV